MTRWVTFENIQLMSKHISQDTSSAILFQFANFCNEYEIRFNTTNYPIVNMQEFRNGLWFSMLDLFWSGGIATV